MLPAYKGSHLRFEHSLSVYWSITAGWFEFEGERDVNQNHSGLVTVVAAGGKVNLNIPEKKDQTDFVSLLRCWRESLLIANYSSCLASKFRRSIKRPRNCCSLALRSFLFLAALALFFRRRYWAMTRHNISTWGIKAVMIRNFNWCRCWSPSDLLKRTCSSMVNCCRR